MEYTILIDWSDESIEVYYLLYLQFLKYDILKLLKKKMDQTK